MTDEEAELEERLENWGRWAHGSRRGDESYLQRLIDKNPDSENTEPTTPAILDLKDALKVNRAWGMLPVAPPRYLKAKMLLGRMYAYPERDPVDDLRRYCQIRVHRREIDELLKMAKRMMANNIRRLDLKERKD